MRISDWSSDVCSSDLGYLVAILGDNSVGVMGLGWPWWLTVPVAILGAALFGTLIGLISVRTEGIYTIMITLAIAVAFRSDEHPSELQSQMRISYAVFCLQKKQIKE